jgi:hypothetical protein
MPSLILDRSLSFPWTFVATVPNRAAVPDRFAEFFDIRKAHERVRRKSV